MPNTLRGGKLYSPSSCEQEPSRAMRQQGHLTVVRNGSLLDSLHTEVIELGSLLLDLERHTLLSPSPTQVQKGVCYLKGKVPSLPSGFGLSLAPSWVRERERGLPCDLFWQGDTSRLIPGTSWGWEVSVPQQPEDFTLSVCALPSGFTTRHMSHRLPMCPSGTSAVSQCVAPLYTTAPYTRCRRKP